MITIKGKFDFPTQMSTQEKEVAYEYIFGMKRSNSWVGKCFYQLNRLIVFLLGWKSSSAEEKIHSIQNEHLSTLLKCLRHNPNWIQSHKEYVKHLLDDKFEKFPISVVTGELLLLVNRISLLGNRILLEYFLKDEALDINTKESPPLFSAIYSKNLETVQFLVDEKKAIFDSSFSIYGNTYTPFEYAVIFGTLEIIDYFFGKKSFNKEEILNALLKGIQTDQDNVSLLTSLLEKVSDFNREDVKSLLFKSSIYKEPFLEVILEHLNTKNLIDSGLIEEVKNDLKEELDELRKKEKNLSIANQSAYDSQIQEIKDALFRFNAYTLHLQENLELLVTFLLSCDIKSLSKRVLNDKNLQTRLTKDQLSLNKILKKLEKIQKEIENSTTIHKGGLKSSVVHPNYVKEIVPEAIKILEPLHSSQ